MTVYVSEKSEDVLSGVEKMKDAMIKSYKEFMPPEKSEITAKMYEEFVETLIAKKGNKYVKISAGGSTNAFVGATDKDKKYKLGDILMAAGYSAPARNKARGNVIKGGYPVRWTGPLYLVGPTGYSFKETAGF